MTKTQQFKNKKNEEEQSETTYENYTVTTEINYSNNLTLIEISNLFQSCQ